MKQFLLLLLMAGGLAGYSQSKASTEILTDATIINLHKAGLDDDLIISKVQNTKGSFDLSTTKLIALKQAGISSAVIKSLMDKTNNIASTPEIRYKAETHIISASTITLIGQPYYFDKGQSNYKPVEKSVANIKVKRKAFGYGGTSFNYEIDGNKSAIRVGSTDTLSFLINTGGAAPELVLYKLKVDGTKRDALGMEYKLMGGTKAADNVISYNTMFVKDGIYKLAVSQKLAPGEYFFSGKPVTSGNTVDVFAFGID